MSETLRIWGAGTARTFRPIWVAEELGIAYEHLPIGPRTGETLSEAYTRLNPKQKVPCLEHGDFTLSESIAMCRYLIEVHGDADCLRPPTSLVERMREEEWISYVYGEIDETSLYVMRRHRDLSAIYGEAPAACDAAKAYALKHLGVTADHLAGRSFLVGDAFGIADVLLVSCLDWAQAYGLTLREELLDYARLHRQSEAYRRAHAINFPRPAD